MIESDPCRLKSRYISVRRSVRLIQGGGGVISICRGPTKYSGEAKIREPIFCHAAYAQAMNMPIRTTHNITVPIPPENQPEPGRGELDFTCDKEFFFADIKRHGNEWHSDLTQFDGK